MILLFYCIDTIQLDLVIVQHRCTLFCGDGLLLEGTGSSLVRVEPTLPEGDPPYTGASL